MSSQPQPHGHAAVFETQKTPAIKRIKESSDFVAEVIGEHSLLGSPMLPATVLDMIDILAGRVARRHSGSNIATVAFDRVDFHAILFHQDLIQAQGHILSVGASSMVIKITVFRYDLMTRQWQLVVTAFVTMVAILEQGIPNKGIPSLEYSPGEERFKLEADDRKKRSMQWMKEQGEVANKAHELEVATLEEPCNKNKQEYLTMAETTLIVRHTFMPRDLNFNQTVFGGEVLIWMHKVAIQCARSFTKNPHMFTLSMNRVSFKKPIWSTDGVEMTARVVFVNSTTLEVEIDVCVTRWRDGSVEPSHSGYFTIENRDADGKPLFIPTGLKLSDSDPECLLRYHKAKLRRHFFESEPVAEVLPPPHDHPQIIRSFSPHPSAPSI